MNMIELNGAHGEGGGQILRTALTLSMLTGIPFRINRIRAKRAKPGLLRQHLTAVSAAAAVCGANVDGAALGSTALTFTPGAIRGGDYRFAIGSAGSTTLVLQTILPALWFADAASTVHVSGGTHNPAAPPVDFLQQSWLPLMRRMRVQTELECLRHGFFPAGGGEVCAKVAPVSGKLQPLTLESRGEWRATRAVAIVAGVPGEVAKRELEQVESLLGPMDTELRSLPAREGPGNVVMVSLAYEHVCETFVAFGERSLAAETVAQKVAGEARRYREGGAAVGEHLADQLALPLALAGGGRFTTNRVSDHLRTNLDVIGQFLPVRGDISEITPGVWAVDVQPLAV
ncbi:RNA 3'-terminal phosphate cyclase [Formivibrio citricus]|nr:RNA 3'-terminal phosphate cyclase [Formivibrio citricus]